MKRYFHLLTAFILALWCIAPSVAQTLTLPDTRNVRGLDEQLLQMRHRDAALGNYLGYTHDASPPSVSHSATQLASSVLRYAYDRTAAVPRVHPAFLPLGGSYIQAGASFPDREAIKRVKTSPSDSDGCVVEVLYTGSSLDFIVKGLGTAGARYRVWVNGRPLSTYTTDTDVTGSLRYVNIAFASTGMRLIRFECSGPFYGCAIQSDAWLGAPARGPGPRWIVFGDSHVDATGAAQAPPATATFWPMGWAMRAGMALGWDVWPSGSGGTGYLNPGSVPGRVKARDRYLTDVAAFSPAGVVFAFGSNDTAYDQGALRAELDTLFALHKATLPSCQTVVTSNIFLTSSPTAQQTATHDTIQAAAAAAGFRFVSLRYALFDANDGVRGVAPSGQNVFIASDGGHLNALGHIVMALRFVAMILSAGSRF